MAARTTQESGPQPPGAADPDRFAAAAPRLLLAAAVAATLAIAAALLFHARPLGDDLCNAANARELGLLGCVRNDYLHWGGRWASQVLACGFPAAFDVARGYPVGLLAVAAVLVVALRLWVGTVLALERDRRLAWSLSLVLVALYWAGMPHPGETVYWLEGAFIYSLNVSLCLVLIACLIRLPKRRTRSRDLATLALVLLATVVAAFHEMFALVLLAVLLTGAAVALRFRDARWPVWAGVAAATVLGLATVALAPGNVNREAHFPEGRSVGRAVLAAARMWLRVLDAPVGRGEALGSATALGWVVDARLLAATVLFVGSRSIRSLHPDWLRREPGLWRLVVPLLSLAVITGSFLVGGWGLGRTLPLRAFDGLYLVFLLGWFLTVFVYTRGTQPVGRAAPVTPFLQAVSALVLAVGLLASTNTKLALRDLADGRARRFAREMALRDVEAARVRERGGAELVVRPIEPWPSSYFRNDIPELLPELRQCVSRYFGVQSLRVGP
jgi:hypothetical protein